MEQTIQFEPMLTKILEIAQFPPEEIEQTLTQYRKLVLKRMTRFILEKLEDTDAQQILKNMPDQEPDEQTITKKIIEIYNLIGTKVSPEDRIGLLFDSQLSLFLEFIDPIIEESTEQEQTQIANILKEDKLFYEMFQEYEKQQAQ